MFHRHLKRIALAIVCSAAAVDTASASEADVMPAAKAESRIFTEAFNQHDAKTLGSLFVDTADFAFLQSSSLDTLQFGLISGRNEITLTLETFFQTFPAARLSHSVRRARLIAPHVMLSDEDFEITGLPRDSGPIKGQFVVVRVQTEGVWRIAAERNVSRIPSPAP